MGGYIFVNANVTKKMERAAVGKFCISPNLIILSLGLFTYKSYSKNNSLHKKHLSFAFPLSLMTRKLYLKMKKP